MQKSVDQMPSAEMKNLSEKRVAKFQWKQGPIDWLKIMESREIGERLSPKL